MLSQVSPKAMVGRRWSTAYRAPVYSRARLPTQPMTPRARGRAAPAAPVPEYGKEEPVKVFVPYTPPGTTRAVRRSIKEMAGLDASPPVSPILSRLTSGYGPRPGRTSGRTTVHQGLDFRARRGDPIYAADDGVVRFIARDGAPRRTRGYGNVVAIRHNNGDWSVYAHLAKIYVAEGQTVHAGELIGAAGNTTNGKFRSMGPHLHFEVREPRPDGGAPIPAPYGRYNVDPAAWLEQRGVDVEGHTIRVDPSRGGVTPASMQPIPKLGDLPDEPVRDQWTFDPLPAGGVILLTALAALPIVIGLWGLRALSGRA
jgi:murein DD-endopeptidase MepM/ murein hydrolase activator NlpD